MKKLLFLCLPLFFQAQKHTKIAFLSDVHFQDVHGRLADSGFSGAPSPKTNKSAFVRSMASQLRSTRVFNENYFALFKALDEIGNSGVKLVVMPGDCTDNGQPFNLRGLRKILENYSVKYGMRFLMTTGNHDPVRPFVREAATADFIDENGAPYAISSDKPIPNERTIVSKDFSESGYGGVYSEMKNFGFTPDKRDVFWQTPFSMGSYGGYTYNSAIEDSKLENRIYEVAKGFNVPDLSYVVEPVEGVWILAIDGNTYIPENLSADPKNPGAYNGAEIGYNNVVSNKAYLFKWIKKVADEAKRRNKALVAFTHYPVLDYNDGASGELAQLLGAGKWQMKRLPSEQVARMFAEAGVRLHFAGHMHINDTGVRNFPGGMLVNVQVPSLAAYHPGYKVLTIDSPDQFSVETKVVKNVPHFNELFPYYEKEYTFLKSKGESKIWDHDILKAKSYGEFMESYLSELVRLRMIPDEWPEEFIKQTKNLSVQKLLRLSAKNGKSHQKIFAGWDFGNAITDLYKFWYADGLAKHDISKDRLRAYKILEDNFKILKPEDSLSAQLKLFFGILDKFSNGAPSENFKIDFKKSTVTALP